MRITRKSDGFVICESPEIADWSPWYSLATVNQMQTIGGVLRPQPLGVEQEAIDLELVFAAHYGNAGGYTVLKNAWRKNRTLVFTDFDGDAYDVRPISAFDSDSQERWKEVRTKNIRILSCTLLKLEYNQ